MYDRSRFAFFLISLVLPLVSCSKPKARDACKTEGAVRCLDDKDALYCIGGKWELAACNGAQGCSGSDDHATCANDVYGVTSPCLEEGKTACSLDNKALLRCEDKH